MNDLHKAAGGEPKDRPTFFLAIDQTQGLILKMLESQQLTREPMKIVKGKGKEQGTYVERELVYAYAMWISPQFHLKVIRAYDRLATQGVAVLAGVRPLLS